MHDDDVGEPEIGWDGTKNSRKASTPPAEAPIPAIATRVVSAAEEVEFFSVP